MVKLVFIFQGSVRKDKARIDLVISVFCAHKFDNSFHLLKIETYNKLASDL